MWGGMRVLSLRPPTANGQFLSQGPGPPGGGTDTERLCGQTTEPLCPGERACVSRPPTSSAGIDIQMAHSRATPASSPPTSCSFPLYWTQASRQCDPESHPAWLPTPTHQTLLLRGRVLGPPPRSCAVDHPITRGRTSFFSFGEMDEMDEGSCGCCTF